VSRRLAAGAALGACASVITLAGCSAELNGEISRLGLPAAASNRSPYIGNLWIGFWIAAFIVGFFTLGLIMWAALRYRRKTADMPKQNRYNLPMEIMYTFVPFVIVGVLFYFTIIAQNRVLAKAPDPDVTVDVVGQKWSWTFNYKEADNPAVGQDVWNAGTIERTPDLFLPVGKSVRFNLHSPDVIHSFWVPAFYQKLDVVPGRQNSFDMTPTTVGTFRGKCTELCGTYHSAMLFNVHVVPEAEYNAYLQSLVAAGQTGEAKGPDEADPEREGR
jgi:cytochrome c oxidase subunit II